MEENPTPWRVEMTKVSVPHQYSIEAEVKPIVVDANGNPVIGGQRDWNKVFLTESQAQLFARAPAMAGEIEKLKAERDAAREVCRMVLAFYGDHGAWGDFASLTSAAGKFAPVADAARKVLDPEDHQHA